MTCQHRSSMIDENACSSGSTWTFRYRDSIRGSRSRKAASRRKPFTAMLAMVRYSQLRRCSSARPRSVCQVSAAASKAA